VVDLTCPKVVELMGGREKWIAVLEETWKRQAFQGFTPPVRQGRRAG